MTSALGELVHEEVAADRADTVLDTHRRDGPLGNRFHGREVERDGPQLRVALRGQGAQDAAGTSDVAQGRGRRQVDPLEERQEAAHLDALHGAQEDLEALLVGVQDGERVVGAALDLVLWLARPQCLGQVAPEAVQARVGHLEQPTDVGRRVLVEERRGVGGVRVLGVIAVAIARQEPERDERVEEVRPAARMEPDPVAELRRRHRRRAERREHLELDRRQQRLRGPETETDLEDLFRGRFCRHGATVPVCRFCGKLMVKSDLDRESKPVLGARRISGAWGHLRHLLVSSSSACRRRSCTCTWRARSSRPSSCELARAQRRRDRPAHGRRGRSDVPVRLADELPRRLLPGDGGARRGAGLLRAGPRLPASAPPPTACATSRCSSTRRRTRRAACRSRPW